MFHLLPQMKYNDAQTALTNGEYTAAAEKFAEISSYKDAADMVEESNYRHAEALLDSDNVTAEDIAQARTLLDTLTDQTRTDDLRKSADYQEGLLLLNEGKLDDAEKLFTALGDYENSRTQLQEIAYRRLSAEMETASDYDAIREGLTALNGYQDSAALIEKRGIWRRRACWRATILTRYPPLPVWRKYRITRARRNWRVRRITPMASSCKRQEKPQPPPSNSTLRRAMRMPMNRQTSAITLRR